MMKKFCKIKLEEDTGKIEECVRTENREDADRKLKDVEGKLFEMKDD